MDQELHEPQENSHTDRSEKTPGNDALDMLVDDILNQQAFSEWNYSLRFRAIRSIERWIKENSRQGKRSDLEETQVGALGGTLFVEGRHKLNGKSRRSTTRDQVADRLGIATATLSKYRRIGKLPDDLIEVLARMLNDRKITFEVAYRMSFLMPYEIRVLVGYVDNSPDKKIDLDSLKALCTRGKGRKKGLTPLLPRAVLRGILIPRDPK